LTHEITGGEFLKAWQSQRPLRDARDPRSHASADLGRKHTSRTARANLLAFRDGFAVTFLHVGERSLGNLAGLAMVSGFALPDVPTVLESALLAMS
jgi:hypothetical protein